MGCIHPALKRWASDFAAANAFGAGLIRHANVDSSNWGFKSNRRSFDSLRSLKMTALLNGRKRSHRRHDETLRKVGRFG